MNKKISVLACSAAIFANTSYAEIQRYSDVTLFDAIDYVGQPVSVKVGDYPFLGNIAVGNDKLSSLIVPLGYTIELYEHSSFSGRKVVLTSSRADLSVEQFNNKASSARVYLTAVGPTPEPSTPVVQFYADGYEHGGSFELSEGDWSWLGEEWDNNISSLKIPEGLTVELYDDKDFTGDKVTLSQSADDLSWFGFNDKASSAKIITTPSAQVKLYSGKNKTGDVLSLPIGDYPHLDNNWRNKITSLAVPQGYSVSLFTENNFSGRKSTFTHDEKDLGSILLANKVKSFKFFKTQDKGQIRSEARLFTDADFRGDSIAIPLGDTPWLGSEWNDQMSSAQIPAGYTLELFEHGSFGGHSHKYTGDVKFLGDYGDFNFNDQASSAKLYQTPINEALNYTTFSFETADGLCLEVLGGFQGAPYVDSQVVGLNECDASNPHQRFNMAEGQIHASVSTYKDQDQAQDFCLSVHGGHQFSAVTMQQCDDKQGSGTEKVRLLGEALSFQLAGNAGACMEAYPTSTALNLCNENNRHQTFKVSNVKPMIRVEYVNEGGYNFTPKVEANGNVYSSNYESISAGLGWVTWVSGDITELFVGGYTKTLPSMQLYKYVETKPGDRIRMNSKGTTFGPWLDVWVN